MNAGKENSLNFVSTKTENKSKKLSEKCGKAGHLRKECKQGSNRSENDQGKKGARHNFVEEVDNLSEDFERLCNIKSVHALKPEKPLEVMLTVQNTPMSFEIDTGSPISAVSYENYVASKELRVLRTHPTARVLRAYPGDKIIPKGIINVNVVVENAIFDEFKDVFSDTLGCYNKRKFSLQLKEGTMPVFKKPRPIPYALRDKIEQEINRLKKAEILEPVKSSQWATPLVPVLKANGDIRLCGDFKVTVNPCLEIDRHPIPRLSDLSTKLAGGKIFSKLDMNQAYQQVLVDNESKQLLVLSTHKGLYACNRLMYRVASAPGLFQREIETLLHDIKGVVSYFNDIFISGPTKTEHDKSLREVLKRLQECNLTLKKNKCSISKDKITFLELELDAEGIRTSSVKTDEITKMKRPEKVPELKSFSELNVEDDCVMWGHRVIIPLNLRKTMLDELHSSHGGIVKMKALARSYMWWPNIDADIENLMKSCMLCAHNANNPRRSELHVYKWPKAPNERIHIDFCGPIEGHMYLVITDAFSKWIDIREMSNITTSNTIRILKDYFATWGLPLMIVSDNGPSFTSDDFKLFLEQNHIEHLKTAPYHHGAAENPVKSFKNKFKLLIQGKNSRQDALAKYLIYFRSTPHCTTGVSPAELQLGRKIRARLDAIKPSIQEKVEQSQAKQKFYFRGDRKESFNEKDTVMTKNFSTNKWEQAVVNRKLGPVTYSLQTESNKEVKRNLDQIRPGLKDSPYIYVDDFSDQLLNDTAKALDVNPVPEPKTVASETSLPVLSKKDPAASSNKPLVLRRSSRIKKAPERLDL
ncbi:uncharacterized protein K02A2.6-like [Copidosoma floridanum]|uniref:uncharacterized protein K02A2.6-like n=1 Tax=Copidosoma floridanum TaxID=29053 RepID=UPI0006C95A39|nr:uncharacterized protein K02A2.6-like [Copidosoma floridanum]